MHRQINVGCSREELHTGIGIPFSLFCCPCCIRCWIVSVDCRKGTGDHVSWKHIAVLQAVKWHQTIKAGCLSHQISFAKGGGSLSFYRRHYGAAASVLLLHANAPLGLSLTARWHSSTWNSLQASVCVFSDRAMAHQQPEIVAGQRVCLFWPPDGTSVLGSRCRPACVSFLTARWRISSRNSLHTIALQHP